MANAKYSQLADQPADEGAALRQWDSAAAGWAKWEPVINRMTGTATEAMLDQAGVAQGSRVIDIACGAGGQTLAAARRAGRDGHVLATDISPAMLSFVDAQAHAAGLGMIATLACTAANLPRDRGAFDAAISRLCLMLLPDPAAAVAAVRGVLRPGGRFGAIVSGLPDANPFHVELVAILRRHANKPAPASGPGFFALADRAVLTALFEHAGFTDVDITSIDASMILASIADVVPMIREAWGGIWGIISDQPPSVQEAAWTQVRSVFNRFETAGGFAAPVQFHVVSGRKPI